MSKNADSHFFGATKVGSKVQIDISKEAREVVDISFGDQVFVVEEKSQGVGIAKLDVNNEHIAKLISGSIFGDKLSEDAHQDYHEAMKISRGES